MIGRISSKHARLRLEAFATAWRKMGLAALKIRDPAVLIY